MLDGVRFLPWISLDKQALSMLSMYPSKTAKKKSMNSTGEDLRISNVVDLWKNYGGMHIVNATVYSGTDVKSYPGAKF